MPDTTQEQGIKYLHLAIFRILTCVCMDGWMYAWMDGWLIRCMDELLTN